MSDEIDNDSEVLSFTLELDPESSRGRAELAENIFQHQASDFTIILRQSHAVHGSWSNKGSSEKQPASLLVYRLELHSQSPKQDRRFKHVSVTMNFQRDPLLNPVDDPVVKCFEPAQGVTITQLPTELERTRENSLGLDTGVTVGVPPASFNSTAHYRKSNSVAWKKNVRVRISGIATKTLAPASHREDLDTERLGDDRVTWSIKENPYEKEIPDSYGLAVLLQRRDDAKFKVVFNVKATVDFRYELSTIVDTFYGRQRMSKLYDPSIQKGTYPDGVHAENLGAVSKGLALAQLSFSHLPEDVKPVEIYKAAEET